MRPLHPKVKADLVEIRHVLGRKVSVAGLLKAGEHHLPFSYTVDENDTEFDHAAQIEEHHARGVVYAAKVDEYSTLFGTEEAVGAAAVKITCCTAGTGGIGHWAWFVSWDETVAGVTTVRILEGYDGHPSLLPSAEAILEVVRADARERSTITERGRDAHARAIAAL